jgi:secreted Zn-dependent insulinase-like peptidase
VIDELLERPKTYVDVSAAWWKEISNRSYCFDRTRRVADAVAQLKKRDLEETFATHVRSRETRQTLAIHIVNRQMRDENAAGGLDRVVESEARTAMTTIVQNIHAFKTGQPVFPARTTKPVATTMNPFLSKL